MSTAIKTLTSIGPFIISSILIFFAAHNIVHHIQHNEGVSHIIMEIVIFCIGLILNLFFARKTLRLLNQLYSHNDAMSGELKNFKAENSTLKEEREQFKAGLSAAITKQLESWGLSPSEVDIAFLLLKGLSTKEIAAMRNTSENTVRIQCSTIYKKSNLHSRSELSAYFLEDLI